MATATEFELTWDLDSLSPNPQTDEFTRILDKFRDALAALATASESLPAVDTADGHVAGWLEFLGEYARLDAQATDLNALVGCHAAADAENKRFQQLEAQLASFEPLRAQVATNVEFALRGVSDGDFDGFVDADAGLKEIGFFLAESRRRAQLRLPKEQELLAADLAVDGIHAWGRLYDRVSGELRVRVMERGEIVEKSPGQIQLDARERSVRENNFHAADKAWGEIADTCADALNHISGTRLTTYRRLGLQDHLDAPLRYSHMQRQTLDSMWSVISERKNVLLPYFERKAQLLGIERLSWFDLLAPLPGPAGPQKELSYDEACRLIIDTFTRFSPDFGDFARHALEKRWIEAEDRGGKRQGGFCTGFPTKQQSRIFMTFTNTQDSMATLAHELGHAYHSHVLREQPLFLQDYPMNLAETASTFAEAVLAERRLDVLDSSQEQLPILDSMLSDAVAFLMNIHARFIFEDNFHCERHDGELSAERFSEIMLAAQKEAYLDALDENGWYPGFWISKLHFYISSLPFYNFPYTFGYLLSLGVYAASQNSGDEFPEQYRQLLIATGCQETEEAVQSTFGHDLSGPAFWSASLDVVEQRVERFLALSQ